MARFVTGKTVSGELEGAVTKNTKTNVPRDERAWGAQFTTSWDVLEELYDEITADLDRLTNTRRARKPALAGSPLLNSSP